MVALSQVQTILPAKPLHRNDLDPAKSPSIATRSVSNGSVRISDHNDCTYIDPSAVLLV